MKFLPIVNVPFVALAMLASAPVLGNDSTATLAAGGLVLAKSDSIEMRSETCFCQPAWFALGIASSIPLPMTSPPLSPSQCPILHRILMTPRLHL